MQARHERPQHPDVRGDVPRQVHGPQSVPQGQGSQQRRHVWEQGEETIVFNNRPRLTRTPDPYH